MRRKRSSKSVLTTIIFISIIAAIVYLAQSPYFEREHPQIQTANQIYWNRKDPLRINIEDNVGIKNYSFKLSDDEKVVQSQSKVVEGAVKDATLEVEYPRLGFNYNKKRFILEITATDTSMWNFFAGNEATKHVEIIVDDSRPSVSVLANSYSINRGGSALVVFRAMDENIEEIYIQTSYGKIFDVQPFYKKGHYIALLAWPVDVESFSAHIVATDIANNETKRRVPYYLTNRKYRVSNINVSDSFINNQITDLARQYPDFDHIDGGVELFKAVNERLRSQNVDVIEQVSTIDTVNAIDDWKIDPFRPLKNGAVQAGYGDHRLYQYNGQKVSESYHLGIDYASIKHASIVASNPGVVKYARFNGLYGNMPVIDHGLGLHSLYGHCSSIAVEENDRVQTGDMIAETGVTGLAFGDHLHFGISIQGVEVRPQEWMDSNWIKLNIHDIINKSKEMIDIQNR